MMILWNILILWISILHVAKTMASIDVNTPAGNPEVQPCIHHHCIVSKLRDVNKSLSEPCKRQLQTTPFGWLLNLHCNIEVSGRMLEVMVASWNGDQRAFHVGDRLIPFTLYDVALMLGLPVRGEPIDCNQSYFGRSLVEKLLNTHLKTISPEWTKLVTLLTKPSIKVPDRVRLYLARVLSYFCFLPPPKKSPQASYHCLMIEPT